MENIKIVVDVNGDEHVIEEFAPNQFRATPKAVWDEQQKAVEEGGTL